MNPVEFEPRRGSGFKEAVLSAAEARKVTLIGEAQRQSARQIAEMQSQCGHVDAAAVAARYAQQAAREQSALLQKGRKALLAKRTELVDALFAEVRRRLSDFTQSEAYPAFLAARLTALEGRLLKEGRVVALRKADERHVPAVKKALPGCAVVFDSEITLGGVKAGDGRVLFNETLDFALEEERGRFYETGGLTV